MTLQANELRIKNLVLDRFGNILEVESINDKGINLVGGDGYGVYPYYEFSELQSIPLTEQWLLKCPNHKKVNGKNILNTIYFEIGRNRVISIGNIGTSNEAIWLCEIDPNIENRITDLVCIHNFDYDGKIMLHQLQNLYFSLTGQELTFKDL